MGYSPKAVNFVDSNNTKSYDNEQMEKFYEKIRFLLNHLGGFGGFPP